MAWQLIYTSAPRLLEAGRSGFGTVARHREIPPLLVSAVERISQFSRQNGFDDHRVIYAHRIVTVSGQRYQVLSSIRDAGADHTGRTNHIAHHLIFSAAEVASALISPADVSFKMQWLSHWSDPPRWLEAGEMISLGGFSPANWNDGAHWGAVTGQPRHAWLLAAGEAAAGCYLFSPPLLDLRPLFAESLALKGERLWQLPFTTSLQPSDEPSEFRWVGMEATSPLRTAAENTGRVVLDLTQPQTLPIAEMPNRLPAVENVPASFSDIASLLATQKPTIPTTLISSREIPQQKQSYQPRQIPGQKQISSRRTPLLIIAIPGVLAVLLGGLYLLQSRRVSSEVSELRKKFPTLLISGSDSPEKITQDALRGTWWANLSNARRVSKAAENADQWLSSDNNSSQIQELRRSVDAAKATISTEPYETYILSQADKISSFDNRLKSATARADDSLAREVENWQPPAVLAEVRKHLLEKILQQETNALVESLSVAKIEDKQRLAAKMDKLKAFKDENKLSSAALDSVSSKFTQTFALKAAEPVPSAAPIVELPGDTPKDLHTHSPVFLAMGLDDMCDLPLHPKAIYTIEKGESKIILKSYGSPTNIRPNPAADPWFQVDQIEKKITSEKRMPISPPFKLIISDESTDPPSTVFVLNEKIDNKLLEDAKFIIEKPSSLTIEANFSELQGIGPAVYLLEFRNDNKEPSDVLKTGPTFYGRKSNGITFDFSDLIKKIQIRVDDKIAAVASLRKQASEPEPAGQQSDLLKLASGYVKNWPKDTAGNVGEGKRLWDGTKFNPNDQKQFIVGRFAEALAKEWSKAFSELEKPGNNLTGNEALNSPEKAKAFNAELLVIIQGLESKVKDQSKAGALGDLKYLCTKLREDLEGKAKTNAASEFADRIAVIEKEIELLKGSPLLRGDIPSGKYNLWIRNARGLQAQIAVIEHYSKP